MTESVTDSLPPDEVRLAQLACVKLANILQGTLSLGLPATVTGVPEPRGFFETEVAVMTGYGQVLHSVSGTVTGQAGVLQLRHTSRSLLTALDRLSEAVVQCLDSPSDTGSALEAVRDAAVGVLDDLETYARMVAAPTGGLEQSREAVLRVIAGVADLRHVETR